MAKHKKGVGKVIVFHENTGKISISSVVDADADSIETRDALYRTEEAATYIDLVRGEPVYIFNANVPALVEAENLKMLRRSVTLKRMFEFDRSGDFDWMKLIPWVIVIALIVFR